MKKLINPYVRKLIKENLIYIGGNVVLILLTIFLVSYSISFINDSQNRIKGLETEVGQLDRRYQILTSPVATDIEEIDSSLKVLNMLVPNIEDYFSIIYALEELSKKTNFIVNSYAISLKKSEVNKLQLIISGDGNKDSFMEFLKEYNYAGGRLVTAEKIELDSQFDGGIKLTVNFYNKDASKTPDLPLAMIEKQQENLKEIKEKVSVLLTEGEVEEDLSYPTKTNPF
jgi:hypothetical protein